jgi:hypothetical protein
MLDYSPQETPAPGLLAAGNSLRLNLLIDDPEILAELNKLPEELRERFALQALRIGVLALQQASGQLDAEAIKKAGEAVVRNLEQVVNEEIKGEFQKALNEYLKSQEEGLRKTLGEHMGAESPIFRALSPTDAQGLQQQLQKLMDRILEERQKKILDEFSLDNSASALNRLISRVQQTNRDLHSQLTETIEKAGKDAQEFQTQVREALASLQTKKTEAAKSTLQGKEFEAALGEVLAVEAEALGDLHQATGALVGAVERSKVGDYVTELGPDHAAAGVRIVWEAKSSGSYNIQSAREELDLAKRNRKAQLGVFVFDGRTASAPATPFQRIGTDLFICWSPDDRITDVYIKAALSVARALALRENSQKSETTEAIDKIENATNIIFKQIDVLDDIKRKASTVKSHGEAIESKAGRMLEILTEQIQLVNERIAALKTNA